MVHIYIGCQICRHCRLGLENQCEQVRRLGFELPGGFAEYVKVPSRNVLKTSSSIPIAQAAILSGSIATVLHGLRSKGGMHLGDVAVIVGCGGVFSATDAYEKIRLGASLVQLITGMIFQGPQLISQINLGLIDLLEKDGFNNVKQVVGASI